jgi:hypothetical protein
MSETKEKSWTDWIFELLAGALTSRELEADGATPAEAAAAATVAMGVDETGYSVLADRAAAAEKLELAQREAMALYPADPLPGGKWRTKCNLGAAHVARALGCSDLDGLTADQDAEQLLSRTGWRADTWARGVKHAQRGGLALLVWDNPLGHGHIATIAPRAMEPSPSFGLPVPVLANVGEPPNDFKLASACFRHDIWPEVKCLTWGETP